MSLRDVIAKRKAEREKPKTLAELRARRQKDNHDKPRAKTLAELRARKQAETPRKKRTLREIALERAKSSGSKADFVRGGLKYHNARPINGYWAIDVTNNDMTFTLHNRHGSWMHSVEGREGWLAEPVRVARALGTDISQLDISMALSDRLDRELKLRGIPTREQLLRQQEEEAKAKRRKASKHIESDQD